MADCFPANITSRLESRGYVITRLPVKFDSPKTILERKLVLKRGVAVQGRVLCSDGKPAAGWRVVALPSWWDFHSSPGGELIKEDGTFVLSHIGPGAYDVTIHMPRGGGILDSSTLLRSVELASQHGPLVLHVDAPSPASMVENPRAFAFLGGRPKQDVWITATSNSARRMFATGRWPEPGGKRSDRFSMGPFPSGKYHLTFDSPEIETKEIDVDTATVKDLAVEVHVRGPIVLRGTVSLPGPKGPELAREFMVRVVRLKYQRGRQPRRRWDRIFDPRGQFTEQVPGPGIYAVEVTADGFLTVRSKPIDASHLPEKEIQITLSKGTTVAGTVVDEAGRPVDGAIVMSREKAGGELPLTAAETPDTIGVHTVAGRFQFEGLRPGKDTFEVVHPDYALATVRNFDVRAEGQEPLNVVLTRGGTICGHVHDEHGRLQAGVGLEFARSPYSYAGQRFGGPFAKAVTDANGYYEVHHLPDELIHILRESRGESPGVYHQAVLAANGKTRTVDLGSGPTVSGRLFLNGVPVATTDLRLGDEEHDGNVFGAQDVNGCGRGLFVHGRPAGEALFVLLERQAERVAPVGPRPSTRHQHGRSQRRSDRRSRKNRDGAALRKPRGRRPTRLVLLRPESVPGAFRRIPPSPSQERPVCLRAHRAGTIRHLRLSE